MYTEFFNFSAEPFRVTPDPGFLYLTDQHREALAAIIYGITKRKGFVCITGEVGVGKTTILRSYLDGAEQQGMRFVHVFNPNVSFQTLLRHILKEMDVPHPGDEIAAMVESLRFELQRLHRRRETLVLLVDEAQNMPIGTLESLRMLSNLETNTEKLMQIVLVGQPELDQLLAERQLRQVESRIAVRTRLGPLSKADSAAYIRHRLKCVALDDQPAFTDSAIAEIVKRCGGIPRRINVLADNALMNAFGQRAKPVTPAMVREAARDLRLRDAALQPRQLEWRPLAWGGGAAVAAALVLGIGWLRQPAVESVQALTPPPLQQPVIAARPDKPPSPQSIALPALPPAVAVETPATVTAQSVAAVPAKPKPVLRIVTEGDTLAGLAAEIYGRADGRALDLVKDANPEITNIDRIQVGQIIEFPAMPAGGYD